MQRQKPLRLEIEPLPGGDKQFELGRGFHQFQDQVSPAIMSPGRRKQMLKVVQNEQHLFLLQVVEQLSLGVCLPRQWIGDRFPNGRHEKLGAADPGEGDKIDPIIESIQRLRRRLQRHPRLADAAHADQGQQVAILPVEIVCNSSQFLLATHKGCGLGRQVMGRGITPGLEPVEQRLRFGQRLDAQLLSQDPAACLVLGQSRALLPAAGQQGHELPVRLFLPRLQRQQAIGVLDTGIIIALDSIRL